MSASSLALTTLRDRVEASLVDGSNAIWATGTIDAGIRQALYEYSEVKPWVLKSDLALTSILSTNGREIDISAVTSLVKVIEVWAPYTAADDIADIRRFQHWVDAEIVYLPDGASVDTTDTARIWYTKIHTLDGLDSAGATTFNLGDDLIIELGSIGYSLLSRAMDLAEQVSISDKVVDQYLKLGESYLRKFRHRLLQGVALPVE